MSIIVETATGRLEGTREDDLAIFRGVPFAAPPVGPLRFRAPQPVEPWAGVQRATEFGLAAPQLPVDFDLIDGLEVGLTNEDCLFLNVYTPGCDAGRRPVLVWIHGGAFTIGSGSQMMYDPRPLTRRGDVVVVTINYRLGALGFLQLDDEDTTANAGLLDQIAALRWVRENIAAFGGDPQNVTVFGESAGGMSVGSLLGMADAKGLFVRAIPMSGAAHSTNSPDTAARVSAELCRELGVRDGDVAALRGISAEIVLKAQAKIEAGMSRETIRMGFRPNEGDVALPERPIDAIARGSSRGVEVLVGCTRDEWRLFGFMDPGAAKLDEASLLDRIEIRAPGHGARIVDAYRAARPGSSASDLFFAIETDRFFRIPAVRLAEARNAQSDATYAYLFTWESPMLGGQLGSCHGIDTPFAFGLIGTKGADAFAGSGPEAEALATRTQDAWLAFARSGAPGHAGLPDWPTYQTETRQTMLLGSECELVSDPLGAERAVWDGVI